jgi:Holliday junction resolvasome RuvABC ATP-dependent DNA helicase subunit
MGFLAETFRNRLEVYLKAHHPTRVLIGGLPDFLIDQIAASWSSQFHLLLVRPGAEKLPANVQRCGADDLTAERQHGWAALVGMHESRGIQESIRSTGAGTVRELWVSGFPWHPCELPGARWADVRNDFIDRLGLNSILNETAVCIDRFREELRGEVDASNRFFAALDSLTQSCKEYSDVCYQLGFPSHIAGRILRKRGVDNSVLALLDKFVERFKEEIVDDALDQFLEATNIRYAGNVTQKALIESALKFFVEEFRHISPAELGNPVVTWRTVFMGNRAQWEILSADVIAALLGLDDQNLAITALNLASGPGIELFDVGQNRVIVRDRNASTPSATACFEFGEALVAQAASVAAVGDPWQLFVRVNRAYTKIADPLPTGKGPHTFLVPLPDEGKQSARFLVGPNDTSERATSKAATLWECCQEYPFVVATSNSKLRAGKRRRSKDEQGTSYEIEQVIVLPTQSRVALHGFIYRLHGNLSAVLPDESSPTIVTGLSAIPNSLCHQFVLNVEVIEGSEIIFSWKDHSGTAHRAMVAFDFNGEAGPRDDSLTGVILHAHGGAKSNEIKDQLKVIKVGNQLSASELSIKETNKAISFWEMHQQEPTRGWWPILVSEGHEIHEQRLVPHTTGYFFISSSIKLNEQANAWRSVVDAALPIEPMPSHISAYVSARTAVLGALGQQFKLSPGESVAEINIARKSAVGLIKRDVLKTYIEAYTALLKAATDGSIPASWRWLVWSLDSVLLFSPYANGPTAHLLGPFHPVTISRLFFLQECLIERLINDDLSSLANIFAQAQPIALGHVVDAQLQAAPAIAYPTGEHHWLWLHRQQGQSDLPAEKLVEWLRLAGFDPKTGPLAVDAKVLPQTLKQYLLAYPSHQTLRLFVEDCSQRTLEVLREELYLADRYETDAERLGLKLPGGLEVYDPITKIKRLNGQLISYDPELPLRWHHGRPPKAVSVDIATLPRSGRVDFQFGKRGGAASTCVPTARRGLLEFSSAGLEVSTVISSVGDRQLPTNLAMATTELLAAFEPKDKQLSWGTSLSMTGGPKANWTLCSASQVDPRLFIEYVKRNPGTALWTYRLFSFGENKSLEFGRGHFLLARVSPSLTAGLQTQLTAIGLKLSPNDLLVELAKAGLTLGDEFLRTGRTAEGALGQYLVERLIWQPAGQHSPLPHWEIDGNGGVFSAGSLLQVDPFSKVLETLAGDVGQGAGDDNTPSRKRSDLVSIQLKLCGNELWIRPVVFESKYLSGGQPDIESACDQAAATASQFNSLLELCLHDWTKPRESFWAQPERLLLAEIIHLGLRLACGSFTGSSEEWHKFERCVLSKVLSGDFQRDEAQAVAIIHHPGATVNNLKADRPHAFVSFMDSNAAQSGMSTSAYNLLQQTLADILRHSCDQRSKPVLPTSLLPVTITEARSDVPAQTTSTSGDKSVIPSTKTQHPAPTIQADASKDNNSEEMKTSLSPSVPDVFQSNKRSEEINRAHKAFDSAFVDFIGNTQAIEKLRDDLVDALIKRPPFLPSAYLFKGNPSTGKTTIANKIAKLLGVTFVNLVGTNIRSEADLVEQVDNAFQAAAIVPRVSQNGTQGLPEHEYPECLIFIDEIHLVKSRAQEGLLTLTEPKDRYIRLRDRICRFPRATYMAATTRPSEIDKALLTRFGNPIHLRDYTVQEVAKMLTVKKGEWQKWPEPVLCGISQLARRIPREAERLVQKLHRKMEVSLEKVPLEVALEKLRLEEGLDRHGLDNVCWSILRYLAKQSHPLGRESLAQQIGLTDAGQIIEEKIPTLVSLGLIESAGNQGLKISDRGRNYIRNESSPSIA